MKIRLEVEISLTKEEIKKLLNSSKISASEISRRCGLNRMTFRHLLDRRGGIQYQTLRKALLILGVDIKPEVREAIDRLLEE